MKLPRPLLVIVGAGILSACAVSPMGKSIDRSNIADIASTGLALTLNTAAQEANPIFYYGWPIVIPMKLYMGRFVETREGVCAGYWKQARGINSIIYGASANNMAIVFGVVSSAAIPIGIAAGVLYYAFIDKIEPEYNECVDFNNNRRYRVTEQGTHEWVEKDIDHD